MKRSEMPENLSLAFKVVPSSGRTILCSGKGLTLKTSASRSSESLSFLGTVLHLTLIVIYVYVRFYLPPPPQLFLPFSLSVMSIFLCRTLLPPYVMSVVRLK